MLKQSNEIPGQHLLEYYADNAYKKFKGRIDLDDCEQVLLLSPLLPEQTVFTRLDKLIMPDCLLLRRAIVSPVLVLIVEEPNGSIRSSGTDCVQQVKINISAATLFEY